AVDLAKLGEHTITIDCAVLQGDGGTRTASVTGGFVALALACRKLVEEGVLASNPIRHFVTGVSAGIVGETLMLDLQYSEDSRAQVDLNCVMNELGRSSSSRAPARAGPSHPRSNRSWCACAPRATGSC
ncbi:MAG: hypothetical protein ACLTYN_15365, partial [Dysosmobacter welbionis]